ncbi:hypothetical protein BKI52_13395 [marine bacterium AO1-C]|nr:hypothetical protein BKI52_13395 [marine bacterium AO1-C]
MKSLLHYVLALICLGLLGGCHSNNLQAPPDMVLVRGGAFIMGSPSLEVDSLTVKYKFPKGYLQSEAPLHEVTLTSFWADKYEVRNKDFKKFLLANPEWQKENMKDRLLKGTYLKHWQGNDYPEGADDIPVYNISWHAAVAYCQWQQKRLPTEAEWEYMASAGGKNQVFPWGDTLPDSTKANYYANIGRAVKVGSYPPNALGIHDLAGNLWEFMADEWSTDFYRQSPKNNPVNGSKTFDKVTLHKINSRRVVRGGSWGGSVVNLRVSFRDSHRPRHIVDHMGCRCVKDLPKND